MLRILGEHFSHVVIVVNVPHFMSYRYCSTFKVNILSHVVIVVNVIILGHVVSVNVQVNKNVCLIRENTKISAAH